MPRTKRIEGVQWRIRGACMKQVDIAMALNVSQMVVSRLLKNHRETGSVLIIECKGLLLKCNGMW